MSYTVSSNRTDTTMTVETVKEGIMALFESQDESDDPSEAFWMEVSG